MKQKKQYNRVLFCIYSDIFKMIREKKHGRKLTKIRLTLFIYWEALMLVPIDFLSCSGSLQKLAEGQFFMGALDQWAEKINRNSAQLDENLAAGQQFYCRLAGHQGNNSIVAPLPYNSHLDS